MTKEQIMKKIIAVAKKYSLQKVSIFGSFAREKDFSDKSDIDVIVELPEGKAISLFDFIDIQDDFKEAVGKKVDLLTENGINKFVRPYIENDRLVVYET